MTSKSSLSHQVRVGIFVALGFVIATVSLFIVGGDRMFKKQSIIFADFESVQGLAEGSVVSLAGIKIGNIQDVTFDGEAGKLRVAMKIGSEYLSRITEGSTIEVRTAGALGDKFLYITPGPISDRHIESLGKVEVLKASDIMSVISEKGGEARRIFEIMKESEILLKSFNNENRIEKILGNLGSTTTDLKLAAQDVRQMMSIVKDQSTPQKVASSMEKLDRILTKIDRGEGTLGALVNDSSLHDSLKNFVGPSEKKKSVKSLIRSSINSKSDKSE